MNLRVCQILRALVLAAAAISASAFSGCLPVPYAPPESVLKSTTELSDGISLHFMNKDQLGPSNRNLIFLAADDESERQYTHYLKTAYPLRATPRLEEAAWWLYADDIRQLYDQVIRIRYDRFSTQSLVYALQYMEFLGKSYDLLLLTHGVPNNIITSGNNPIFTWRDLDRLRGKLPKLRMVFMQGCFGQSLVPDWKQTGARSILSYPDLNRNFFYYSFFLKSLEKSPDDIELAYQRTNSTIASSLKASPLYTQMISILGISMDEYLRTAPNPDLDIHR